MITAVDTSVLLDVFTADPTFLAGSQAALRECAAEGSLIACDVVWAEVAAQFTSKEKAAETLQRIGLVFAPMAEEASLLAAQAWRAHRRQGGSRARVVSDFLIGAHAQLQADRLLTRDRGFYRSYFKPLVLVDPSSS